MKKILQTLFILFVLVGISPKTFSQAQLQLIHNSADPGAIAVDVYIDGQLKYDDFYYLTGTPMDTVNSGVTVNIGIAPSTSASVNDTIKNFEMTFNAGEKYVALINGVLNPATFASNPDGIATDLTVVVRDNAEETSANGIDVDYCFIHGATDLAQCDVVARLFGSLLNDAKYNSVTGYTTVAPATYITDINPYSNNDSIISTYKTDLSAFGGYAVTLFISGFVDPSGNQNGPVLGIYGAQSNGSVTQFSPASLARLQAIQNCADPLLDSIDIYMFGYKVFDDFKFRTATPYQDVPAGVPLTLGIAPGNSTSENDTIKAVTLQFENGKTYIGFASGVFDTTAFALNPDGLDISFKMISGVGYREKALTPGDVDFVIEHGVTDGDSATIKIHNGQTLFQDAKFGDVSPYITLPANHYYFDAVNAAGTVLATSDVDLSNCAGKSAALFYGGFADSVANQNGHNVAFYAAFADGSTVELPFVTLASMQLIHNSADPAAASVDVYKNGQLWLNDFNYLSTTPFMDIVAGTNENIGVALSTSTSVNDTIKNFPVNFAANSNSVGLISGVLFPANFAVNPNGLATDLSLFTATNLHTVAINSGDVDFVSVNGVTDAPASDLIARNSATVGNDVSYGSFAPYASLPASDYLFDITDVTGSTIYYTFNGNLTAYANEAGVVFASGFVDPGVNQNGAALGLYLALPNGTVVPFSETTGMDEFDNAEVAIYPNPVSDELTIQFKKQNEATIIISDVLGNEIKSMNVQSNATVKINVSDFSKGLYFVKLKSEAGQVVKKIIVE